MPMTGASGLAAAPLSFAAAPLLLLLPLLPPPLPLLLLPAMDDDRRKGNVPLRGSPARGSEGGMFVE